MRGVIVTAQKRAQPLQDVPMTVDALQGTQLQNLAIYDFQDISQLSPGLVISNEDSTNQTIQLRGISFEQYSGATPGVTVYWNGAEIDPQAALRPMFDLQQIEVLRGAQGSLRGDTSPAGQITIATRKPDLDRFGFDVQQTVGNNATLNTQGAISIPIVKHVLAIRLAGLYDRNDGNGVVDIVNGAHNRTQTQAGRVTIEFRPNNNFNATLVYQHENANSVNYSQVAGPGDSASFPLSPNGPALTPQDVAAVQPGPASYRHQFDIGVLNVKWDFSDYQLNYTGSYWDDENPSIFSNDYYNVVSNPPAGSFSGTYPAFAETLPTDSQRQYSNELRFESTGRRFWNFMVGAYYSHSSARVNVYEGSDGADTTTTPGAVLDSPGADAIHVYIPETLATEALFTDQRFQLTSRDQLEVGLRYSRYPQERQSTLFIGLTPAAFGVPAAYLPAVCGYVPGATYGNGYCNLPPQSTIAPADASITQIGRTGSVSFTHHFDRNIMAYARYARSYRPGGPDVGVAASLPLQYLVYQPETSDSYELGIKMTLFQDREQILADVFHQKFHGFIASTGPGITYTSTPSAAGTPTCPAGTGSACNVSLTTNGPAETTGFELSARTKFTNHLYTQVNVAYADAHYDKASLPCNDYLDIGVPNSSGTPRVQPNQHVSSCVTSQSLSPTVGPWQVSANGDYSHPVLQDMQWYARGLVTFSSAAPGNPGAGLATPATAQVNAFLGLRGYQSGHSWNAFLYVRNLFDSRYFRQSSVEQYYLVPTGYYSVFSMPERQYGVTVSYEY